MRHDNSYRRARRSYRQASMSREATMERIAGLELKVAAMEYQAGMTDSLKGLFLKYVAEPLDKYRRHLNLFSMPVDDLMDDVCLFKSIHYIYRYLVLHNIIEMLV